MLKAFGCAVLTMLLLIGIVVGVGELLGPLSESTMDALFYSWMGIGSLILLTMGFYDPRRIL